MTIHVSPTTHIKISSCQPYNTDIKISSCQTYNTYIKISLQYIYKDILMSTLQYKIISITHNLLHITEPKYLHRLINIKPPSRTRSSAHLCLSLQSVSTRLKFADRSFRNSSPRLWNSLSINLRSFAPNIYHSTRVTSSTPFHPCRTLSLSQSVSFVP